jgi:hypothetical protein
VSQLWLTVVFRSEQLGEEMLEAAVEACICVEKVLSKIMTTWLEAEARRNISHPIFATYAVYSMRKVGFRYYPRATPQQLQDSKESFEAYTGDLLGDIAIEQEQTTPPTDLSFLWEQGKDLYRILAPHGKGLCIGGTLRSKWHLLEGSIATIGGIVRVPDPETGELSVPMILSVAHACRRRVSVADRPEWNLELNGHFSIKDRFVDLCCFEVPEADVREASVLTCNTFADVTFSGKDGPITLSGKMTFVDTREPRKVAAYCNIPCVKRVFVLGSRHQVYGTMEGHVEDKRRSVEMLECKFPAEVTHGDSGSAVFTEKKGVDGEFILIGILAQMHAKLEDDGTRKYSVVPVSYLAGGTQLIGGN